VRTPPDGAHQPSDIVIVEHSPWAAKENF